MQITLMPRLLLCAVLIAACNVCVAEEATAPPPGGPTAPTAMGLLLRPVQTDKIEGGTTLGSAVDKILSPAAGFTAMVGQRIIRQVDWSVTLDAQLLPLPEMSIAGLTIKAALDKVVEAAGADCTFSLPKNLEGIAAAGTSVQQGLSSSSYLAIAISRKHSSDLKRLVYFEVAGQRLDYVVQELLRSTNLNYVVSPEIGGLVVNATLKGVPMDVALGAVLRAVGADYRIDSSIVYVTPTTGQSQALRQIQLQQASQPSLTISGAYAPSSRSEAPKQKVVSQAVQFKNLNAGEVAPMISKPGVNVLSTNSNNAVITGPEDQVKAAASLIASLDKDEALPRPVRVNVSAKATWTAPGGKPVVATMSPSLSMAEGRDGALEISSQAQDKAGLPGMCVNFKMHAQPTVTSDGRISISGSFAFEWAVKTANVNQVLLSSPDVPITASLEPGKAQNVASIKMGTGKDGEAVLDVTFTATIEKGRISPSTNSSSGGGGYGGNSNGSFGGRTW